MKIYLYLYDYDLTFTSVWNCLFFPNVGEHLYIFPFLSQEDRTDLEDILCGDVNDKCNERYRRQYIKMKIIK